jgi:hypothetical protein
MRNICTIVVREPEGKRPFGRPSHKWEENMKMGLKVIVFEDVNRIHLAQVRNQRLDFVDTVINHQFSQNAEILTS